MQSSMEDQCETTNCRSRVQVETRSKRDEVLPVRGPNVSALGMYLLKTVGRIVYSDTVRYSIRLLYHLKLRVKS